VLKQLGRLVGVRVSEAKFIVRGYIRFVEMFVPGKRKRLRPYTVEMLMFISLVIFSISLKIVVE